MGDVMLNQRTLLRIILFSLGIAAVVGAFGILVARSEVIAQIDATLILTAICCGALLWVFKKSSNSYESQTLTFSTLLVAIEFGLGCIAIWCSELSDKTSIAAVESMGAIALTGLPVVLLIRIRKLPASRIAAWVGMLLSAFVLLVWLCAITLSWNDNSNWNLFAYGWVVEGCGILTVAALVGFGIDHWHWRWIGIACAAATLVVTASYIGMSSLWQTQPQLVLMTISLLIAHANLSLRCPLKANQRWLAFATVITVAMAGLFSNLSAYENSGNIRFDTTQYERLAGASVILASSGTIALAILFRINVRLKPAGERASELKAITLICPLCLGKQIITGGAGVCDECGLMFTIKLEEPQCAACGYSLLMFKGSKCPECGAAISAQTKTQGASTLGV